MINTQNFNGLVPLLNAVHGNIGKGREQNFSGAFLGSPSATVGRFFQ
jgi:hypothetical protein